MARVHGAVNAGSMSARVEPADETPSMANRTSSKNIEWETLGRAIRERRLAHRLTLVELAAKVDLSQPFLSQIENGRARPSMTSLYRIAHALDTTPQAFFGGPIDGSSSPSLVRADEAPAVNFDSDTRSSAAHLLLAGEAPFHVLEYDGLPREFGDYWEHDGFEAVYVVSGDVEIDIDGELSQLKAGDFLSYPSRIRHRLRSPHGTRARVLLIETKVESLQDRRPGSHVRKLSARPRPRRPQPLVVAASAPVAPRKPVRNTGPGIRKTQDKG